MRHLAKLFPAAQTLSRYPFPKSLPSGKGLAIGLMASKYGCFALAKLEFNC